MQKHESEKFRYIVKVEGIVQGVGFRPYVYNKAKALGLAGYVNNDGAGVVIDLEGGKAAIKQFMRLLTHCPPPLAQIENIRVKRVELKGYTSFDILQSSSRETGLCFIPKDTAICEDCKSELFEQHSRWQGYAFTNCTNCGPRYSIIEELPYDRCNTSMKSFEMCSDCRHEYENPDSRRFHAQPVCCEDCGPQLQLLDAAGRIVDAAHTIQEAAKLLKAGKLLAVKGLGGFHLMCDAENAEAVRRLRARKHRPHRPLAVMAADMASIEQQCIVGEAERQLLQSPQCPIVLLKRKPQCSLPENIAADTDSIGVMLPYTPLHFLLFAEGLNYLVATSGNLSGQPIEYQNDRALHNLGDIVDYFLLHNRDIHIPIDDAVAKVFRDKPILSRIGRGYAPLSMRLDVHSQLVALGAEQKASVSLSKDGYVHSSQYLGDIKSPEAFAVYKKVLGNLMHLLAVKPQAYVHDFHPGYLSTQYAKAQGVQCIGIQHHHAHMAGCMAEHGLAGPVIGVIYDGTGLGTDGQVWGGEILAGTMAGFTRAGHLRSCRLQGGDKAVEEPWRTALSYIHDLGVTDWSLPEDVDSAYGEAVQSALQANFNCFQSTSMGRLFDGVSAMLGLCSRISYDAQPAIRLEKLTDKAVATGYDYEIVEEGDCTIMDYRPILEGVLADRSRSRHPAEISGKFHYAVADMTVEAVKRAAGRFGINDVVLSGGCFENMLLLERLVCGLESQGFQVYYPQKLPCNDGGISFGQLTAAEQILRG